MIYISEDNSSMIFSLQYPHSSDAISKAVREFIEKQYSDYLKVPNKWKVYNDYTSANINIECSDLMYDDATRCGCKYLVNKHDIKTETTINTGTNKVKCIVSDEEVCCEDCEIW